MEFVAAQKITVNALKEHIGMVRSVKFVTNVQQISIGK